MHFRYSSSALKIWMLQLSPLPVTPPFSSHTKINPLILSSPALWVLSLALIFLIDCTCPITRAQVQIRTQESLAKMCCLKQRH